MFFIILFLSVIFLIAVSARGYYNFFKEKKHGRILFFLLLSVLVFNLVIAVRKSKILPFEILKKISFFVADLTFIALIYSSFFFIIRWIFLKTAKHYGKSNKLISFVKSKGKSALVIFSLMVLLATVGYINMGIFRETNYTCEIDKSADTKELDCVIISDTHIGVGVYANSLDNLVKKVNSKNPDVIFLVGDIVDESTSPEDIEKMTTAFRNLKSRKGTFYVSGNHEGYANFDCNQMEKCGITVLDDKSVQIDGISIIGRKDGHSQRKDLKQIISDENIDKEKPILVLNHEPLQLEQMNSEGADLTICGHTHGEQFPLTKKLFSLANDMMYGTKKFGNMTAITTSGAGGWGFHFKFPAKSEIVSLKIKLK